MIPTIWYIHGAGASAKSFVYLKTRLPEHHSEFLTYEANESLSEVITRLSQRVALLDHPIIVLGHSLGGLVALGLHDCPNVEKVVTLCAPFGGLASAGLMSFFTKDNLFKDLASYSSILTKLRSIKITKPMLSIVATVGLPFTKSTNDGVVTQSSATNLTGPDYRTFAVNHFEVLMDDDVAETISNWI